MRRFVALLIGAVSCVSPAFHAFSQGSDSLAFVSLLALGDVNLGRTVGQEILKGNVDYPFEKFKSVLSRGELVVANLECPVTDQNGETQSPKSNVIFCAPPGAAATLRRAGISVAVTANNHAFDYGLKGLQETIHVTTDDMKCANRSLTHWQPIRVHPGKPWLRFIPSAPVRAPPRSGANSRSRCIADGA